MGPYQLSQLGEIFYAPLLYQSTGTLFVRISNFQFFRENFDFFGKTLSIIFFVIGPTPFIAAWWFLLYIFSILIPRDTFCSFLAIWFFPWEKLNFTLNYLIPICGHPNHRSLVYFLCNFVIPISRNTACPFFIIYFFHEIIFLGKTQNYLIPIWSHSNHRSLVYFSPCPCTLFVQFSKY